MVLSAFCCCHFRRQNYIRFMFLLQNVKFCNAILAIKDNNNEVHITMNTFGRKCVKIIVWLGRLCWRVASEWKRKTKIDWNICVRSAEIAVSIQMATARWCSVWRSIDDFPFVRIEVCASSVSRGPVEVRKWLKNSCRKKNDLINRKMVCDSTDTTAEWDSLWKRYL